MIIKAVRFKRTSTSPWEGGITIEGGELSNSIIDVKGNIVGGFDTKNPTASMPSVYKYKNAPFDLCIDLEPMCNSITEQYKNDI